MSSELSQIVKLLEALKLDIDARFQKFEERLEGLEQQAWIAPDKVGQVKAGPHDEFDAQAKQLRNQLLSVKEELNADFDKVVEAPSEVSEPESVVMNNSQNAWVVSLTAPPVVTKSLLQLLLPLLGSFAALFEPFFNYYKKYRDAGKAPVFLMTLVGVVALTVGFGYLLQYSFYHYLSTGVQLLLGFLFAVGVIYLGMRLAKRQPELADYSASLIGLGVTLNYLCAYFMTLYFPLVSAQWGLPLLALITGAAYGLAMRYQTKIVATLSLFGGALTPILLGDLNQISGSYFLYLLVLLAAILHLAYRIQWSKLSQMALLVAVAMSEYLLLEGDETLLHSGLFLIYLHGLFYLFSLNAYVALRSGLSSTRAKSVWLTFTVNLIFFVSTLYQLLPSESLGWVYGLSGVLLLFFYLAQQRFVSVGHEAATQLQPFWFLPLGLLFALALLCLLNPQLLALSWGLEALLLIYLGLRLQNVLIRYEGYFALLIALGQALFEVGQWLLSGLTFSPSFIVFLHYDLGWMNLLCVGLVLWLVMRLLRWQNEFCLGWEHSFNYLLQEFFSVWIAVATLLSVMVWVYPATLLFSQILLFVLLYRAKRWQLPVTEKLALAHYGLLLYQVLMSANQVGSFSFRAQDVVGAVAQIQLFSSLWLIAEFYRRFYPNSDLAAGTEKLRVFFYALIPLLLIFPVMRHYPAYLPLVLWLSSGLALWLYTRLNYRLLKQEFYLLTGAAWIVVLVASFLSYGGYVEAKIGEPLLVGLFFFVLVGWLWSGYSRDKMVQRQGIEYALLQSWGLYYFATLLFIVSFILLANISISLLLMSIYFSLLCYFWPKIYPGRGSVRLSYRLVWLSVWFNLIMVTLQSAELESDLSAGSLIIQVVLLGYLLSGRIRSTRLIYALREDSAWQLWYFNLLLILVYSSLINAWLPSLLQLLFSMMLVLHATLLLVMTLQVRFKSLTMLSVLLYGVASIKILFFDMMNFSLPQKVIAFMLIGGLLLAASYVYQRVQQRHLQQ